MRKQDFDFILPPELIAQQPLPERADSRLLVIDAANHALVHSRFRNIGDWLRPGDLLVLNDTRVWNARLYGTKASGGRVELLLERLTSTDQGWFHIRVSKKPKPGQQIMIGQQALIVEARDDALFALRMADGSSITELLAREGHVPLPPYIDRADVISDRERYQTVFAREAGSAAAPTAGLHFDSALLQSLAASGVDQAFLTLHVGAGTYQNLREDALDRVVLHREWCSVSAALVARIEATKAAGGRVIAVGTTAARSLESAAQSGRLAPFEGDTQLFIWPGFEFKVVDALITNFHLPQSSLLMLVCAFAGTKTVLDAYDTAVGEAYRFFSYGDACLVFPPHSSAGYS